MKIKAPVSAEAYQVATFKFSISLKWASREINVRSCKTAIAAIQMSFSGRGLPLRRKLFLILPYTRAVSVSHPRTKLLEAKSSMRDRFYCARADLCAP